MKTFLKIIGSIISFIICIVLIVMHLATHIVVDMTKLVSKDNITNIVQNIDVDSLLTDENGNKTELYGTIDNMLSEYNFTSTQKESLIKSKALKNIVSEIFGTTIESMILGEKGLTKEQFNNLVDQNFDEISDILGSSLSATEKQTIKRELKNNSSELIDSLPNEQTLFEGNEEALKYAKIVADKNTTYYMIGAIVLVTLLIALFKWSFRKCLRDSGIVTLITSILILLISIVPLIAPSIINITGDVSNYANALESITKSIMMPFLISGGIGTIAGIIQLVIAGIWKRKQKKTTEEKKMDKLYQEKPIDITQIASNEIIEPIEQTKSE